MLLSFGGFFILVLRTHIEISYRDCQKNIPIAKEGVSLFLQALYITQYDGEPI